MIKKSQLIPGTKLQIKSDIGDSSVYPKPFRIFIYPHNWDVWTRDIKPITYTKGDIIEITSLPYIMKNIMWGAPIHLVDITHNGIPAKVKTSSFFYKNTKII